MKILIITNGDSAVDAIKKCEILADFIPWRDILHDGPVPKCDSLEELSKIRAEFLSTLGWGIIDSIYNMFRERDSHLKSYKHYGEVILWFEHDLYDQLQLLQILDWFSKQVYSKISLKLICADEFISENSTNRLLHHFENRKMVSDASLKLAHSGWEAFCSSDVINLQKFIEDDYDDLPFLSSTLKRFLQEFPNERNGLSRSERQILEILMSGNKIPLELFIKFQEYEEAKYLGDWTFYHYIKNLIDQKHPLVETTKKVPFNFPPAKENNNSFLYQKLQITEIGRKVLSSELNHVELNGIDKWLGGIHLTN